MKCVHVQALRLVILAVTCATMLSPVHASEGVLSFTRTPLQLEHDPNSTLIWTDFHSDFIDRLALLPDPTELVALRSYAEDQYLDRIGGYADGANVAVGYLNMDAYLDIVETFGDSITVRLGGAYASFTTVTTYQAGVQPVSLALAHYDFDDNLDIFGCSNNSLFVMRGIGDGSFHPPLQIETGYYYGQILAFDFNRDGSQDLAVAATFQQHSSIQIMLNNGDGIYRTVDHLPCTASVNGTVKTADANHDQFPDLFITDNNDRDILYYEGDGTGHFKFAQRLRANHNWWQTNSMTLGDFNGDTAVDVATLAAENQELVVFLNDVYGHFDQGTAASVTFHSFNQGALASGALNTDGLSDLIVYTHEGEAEVFLSRYKPINSNGIDLAGTWASGQRNVCHRISGGYGCNNDHGRNVRAPFRLVNLGNQSTGPFQVFFYVSTDPTLSTDDRLIDTWHVPGLQPREDRSRRVRYKRTDADDVLHIIALIDPANAVAETDETDQLILAPVP